MRISTITSVTFAFLAAVSFSATARAEQEFDVSAAGGQITVTAHTGYHINHEYPWKVIAAGEKFDKSKFALGETSATITVPKGKAHLKGAVCAVSKEKGKEGGGCMPFEKDIEVK